MKLLMKLGLLYIQYTSGDDCSEQHIYSELIDKQGAAKLGVLAD